MNCRGPTIATVKALAQERIFDVLGALGIREKPSSGGYISMCNPIEKDRHPSFTIWTRGGAVGCFKDHRGVAQGDIIGLVAYIKGWEGGPKKGVPESLRFLSDLLGLDRVDPAQLARDRARAQHTQKINRKNADEELARQQGEAFKLFIQADGDICGSPVWTYLRNARGIDLAKLPRGPRGGERTPSALRFIPDEWHTEAKRPLPCMIACCTDRAGDIKAVHRTWLKPDGSGKANDLAGWKQEWAARKVWPNFTGLVIPLWRGSSGLSVKEAAAQGLRETLQMGEGVEKSLAMALAQPDYRTWAFISLGNLRNVTLPECVDGVIVQRDNEWHNRQASQSFDTGLRALEAQGRLVSVVSAFHGKDFDDTLLGE